MLKNKQLLIFTWTGMLFMLLMSTAVRGQSLGQVNGTVMDRAENLLSGVTVVLLDSTGRQIASTSTNEKGLFVLRGLSTGVKYDIRFTSIGHEPWIEAGFLVGEGDRNSLLVRLEDDTASLDEVVVVGYGTVKRSDLTGSVSEVSGNSIKDLPVASVDQKLVGRVAGVQIQQVSGAPGAGTSVKIRGSGSLGAGNEPLYVIDGMPYSSGLNQSLNPLTFINSNDIENITVLKDASSTAIYGSRGANGVIMITTKTPSKEMNQISYSGYVGVQNILERGRPQVLNALEFAEYQRDRIDGNIRTREGREPVLSDYPEEYRDLNALVGKGTNWYNLLLQTARVQDHNVSIQKGMGNSRTYVSFGYYEQQGVIKETGIKRFTGNFGYTANLGKNIRMNATIKPAYIDQDRTLSGTGRDSDVTSIALWANPVVSPYDAQGNLVPYLTTPVSSYNTTWSFPNPLFVLQESKRNYKELRNLGSAFIEWEPITNLKIRSSINTVFSASKYNQYIPSTVGSANNPPAAGKGSAAISSGDSFDWLIENTASYFKVINRHALTGLVGYTAQKATANGINLNAGPFANDLIHTINAAQEISSWDQAVNEWSMISYLGRLNYAYNDKYLLTATLRSDGSSRFGDKNRFAFFPSLALAWKISDENFMKEISAIEQLKLRASYGKSGNNNIGNYSHLSNVSLGQYAFNNNPVSAASVSLFNPYLGWEESEQIDVGLEMGLFQGRLSFVADLYNRKSVNMLLNDIIPAITGFNNQLVNKGSVRNSGIELGIDAFPMKGQVNWNVNFNVAFNRNEILGTNENGDRILSGDMDGRPTNVSIIGKPIGQFYGFILEGVYSQKDMDNPNVPKYAGAQAGYPKYKDLNGDGVVSELLDYTDLGSPHPNFIFGFSNGINYQNFDLSISLNGQKGGYIMNGMRQTLDNLQGFFNVGKEWTNRWRSEEVPGDGIHAIGPNAVHRINDKLWLEDASYLRITNLTVGYTFPMVASEQRKSFNNLRLYLSAQNLATFTKYKGANPEGQATNVNNTLAPGYDMNSYPVPRAVTLGVNVQF